MRIIILCGHVRNFHEHSVLLGFTNFLLNMSLVLLEFYHSLTQYVAANAGVVVVSVG